MANTPTKSKTAGDTAKSVETAAIAQKAPPFKIEAHSTRKRYLKMLIYGDYGVGKTFLAGTACEVDNMNDIILINAESGDLTLESEEFPFKRIDSVTITTYRQMGRVHEYLKLHCQLRDDDDIDALKTLEARFMDKDIKTIKKPRMYHTVIIDTLSEVETYCMYQLLGVTDATKLDEETQGAEWAEYKKNNQMIQRLVRQFRDLPMHVIMTCARSYVQDENKKFNFSPALTGKLGNQVQGFVDLVGYYVLGAVEEGSKKIPRRLYVQPIGRFSAKCRFSTYKEGHFDDPTVKGILEAVGLAT